LGIGALLLLLMGALARVWQQPWADPLQVAVDRIKPGMSKAEVEGIVGRKPDVMLGMYSSGWYGERSVVYVVWEWEISQDNVAYAVGLDRRDQAWETLVGFVAAAAEENPPRDSDQGPDTDHHPDPSSSPDPAPLPAEEDCEDFE